MLSENDVMYWLTHKKTACILFQDDADPPRVRLNPTVFPPGVLPVTEKVFQSLKDSGKIIHTDTEIINGHANGFYAIMYAPGIIRER